MTAPTRRQFLATSAALPLAAGAVPARTPDGGGQPRRSPRPTADAVIFILMTGGPSQLDTFDPKPDAATEIRGPFGTIPTRTPGVRVSELFPKLAAMSHRWSLIRSMTSDAPPIHEVGMQLVNTGRRFAEDEPMPNLTAVIDYFRRGKATLPSAWHFESDPDAGGDLPCGMSPWPLAYQPEGFGYSGPPLDFRGGLRWALHTLAEGKRRAFAVRMFHTVFDAPSWDCHADNGSLACDLGDYRNTVAPLFDDSVSTLIDHLHDRGLLDRTLVVATGEFGRTPKPNCNGGRDHWPGCWTTLVAGGGVQGGRVVGRSDRIASEPADRPVTPAELVATIFHAVGIPADATIPGPKGEPVAVYNAKPVSELF